MAEEKKPKIDLKSRLGKKTIAGPITGALPPPVGVPKPAGVPAPPFAQPAPAAAPAARPAPKVDASDPYGAIAAADAPVRAEPAAIKVEVSEELVQAQSKRKTVVVVVGVIGALIGGLLGFTMGDRSRSNAGAKMAVEDAARLAKEIETSNQEADELAEVLREASNKLAASKYPAEEVSKLGGIRISFSGMNLAASNIGRFKPQTVTMLIDYSSRSQEANDKKDKLQAILGGSRAALTEILEEKDKPKVRWGVYMQSSPRGPWVNMQLLPTPFLVDEKDKKDFAWPKEFEIKEGQQTHKLKRYSGGDPTRNNEVNIIPVNPSTQGEVCPNDTLLRLRREVSDMQEILKGRQGQGVTADQEKPGLVDTGTVLVEQLKAIGASAG